MPELRKDPILDRWVVVSPERSSRPLDHDSQDSFAESHANCPFCRGRESETSEATLTIDQSGQCIDGESDWLVRVVPNTYPALSGPVGCSESPGPSVDGASVFQRRPGCGVHEVIVEAPQHVTSLTALDSDQIGRILTAWQTRLEQLGTHDSLRHVSLFRNNGPAAGASLAHVHSQLLATTFVPPLIQAELQAAIAFRKQGTDTIWADLVRQELDAALRIVSESDFFTVFCPFASRLAGEIWIVPRVARPEFSTATSDEISDLANVLHDTLCRLDVVFGKPAFNLAVHTAPFREPGRDAFHWHIEITPRLAGIAGFELSSGTWINVVAPEDAAARLRDASV
jgi:UDPglucose--hexose-1-phosphate uridylyltransferase